MIQISMVEKEKERIEDVQIETPNEDSEALVLQKPGFKQKLSRLLGTKKRKVIAAVCAVVVLVAVIFAVPVTRYGIIGNFIKRDVTIVVVDASTKKPVSQATVSLAGRTASTSSKGSVSFTSVPAGNYTVTVAKKYYKDVSTAYTVPILNQPQQANVPFVATGRQVVATVINKITQKPVEGVLIHVGDTSAETNADGLATIVLPTNRRAIPGDIEADGYNKVDVTVAVTDNASTNKFSVTPAGRVFFLSKLTGVINVMSANLDGSEAKVVLQGTGKERDNSTSQLAARDWSFVALQAHRSDDSRTQLYVINAKTGETKTVDAGDVDMKLVGWSGHRFVYEVIRSYETNADKRNVLKSYDADSGKLTTIDETQVSTNGSQTQSESIDNMYIVDGRIVYSKTWSYSNFATTNKSAIMLANADGSGKARIKEFAMQQYIYIDAKPYEPAGIYFAVTVDSNATIYQYEDGAVKQSSVSSDDFNNDSYPTYLLSPSSKQTFWFEPRDGKNTIFVGDGNAKDPKTLATLSDYSTYGWYSDDYVLLSKGGSELYVAAANEPFDKIAPLKVTDYHKPTLTYPGYGAGYGGI
jgi:hypothetical protein